MSDEILYLHCRKGLSQGIACKLDALIFEDDLMIVCKDHGAVHVQPYVGPQLNGCQHPLHLPQEGSE